MRGRWTAGSMVIGTAVLALGMLSRACSPSADTAHATLDGGVEDAVADASTARPTIHPTHKPIPQTPTSLDPMAVASDAAPLGAVREPPLADPVAPPPPPEAR